MLTDDQVAFFKAFGFLKLSGVFAEEFSRVEQSFEEVFASGGEELFVTHDPLHGEKKRCTIPAITDKHSYLKQIETDPRITSIAASLIGSNYEHLFSDGSLFYCDSNWHADIYGAPLKRFHIKISLYMEQLEEHSGAIRVLPGSHFYNEEYARILRKEFKDNMEKPFGMKADDIPGYVLETEPGDVVVWNFRTIHGSYFGADRRRLLSLNFAEPEAA